MEAHTIFYILIGLQLLAGVIATIALHVRDDEEAKMRNAVDRRVTDEINLLKVAQENTRQELRTAEKMIDQLMHPTEPILEVKLCPECNEQKEITNDDYICPECRKTDSIAA
jgi:rubrerythrin